MGKRVDWSEKKCTCGGELQAIKGSFTVEDEYSNNLSEVFLYGCRDCYKIFVNW